MAKIYQHPTIPNPEIPAMDLLTLMFDTPEQSVALDDTVLHVEAANPSNKMTKAQLRDLVERIAYSLRNDYGIGKNGPSKDVVTIISYGQILAPAAFYGVIAAGGVYSAASPTSTASDLVRQVTIGESNLIICGEENKDTAAKAAAQCNIPLSRVLLLESDQGNWSLKSLQGAINAIGQKKLSWKPITDETELKNSVIIILWSSGTTGLPKGVMLSHRNLVAETYLITLQGRLWAMKEIERVGLENFEAIEYRTLAHLPISHIAGVFGYLIGAFFSGGTAFWMRRYKWSDMLKYARQYKVTAFYTVPSIYLRISKSRDEVGDAFKYVEGATTGAAPMDEQLQTAANKRMGDGSTIYIGQTWGLSETTGAVTAPAPKDQEPDATGSISPIMPGVQLRVVDEDFNDIEDPATTPGEFIVKSPMNTNGYWKNEKATKELFHDGWLCSGDLGIMKNGKFYIVDRKKELLKNKGQQIAPAELENLLFTHPHISEAAVIGVRAPNDPGSDWPRAYVVADPKKVSVEEIKQFVKERVAPYKQLRGGVVFVNEIPKNAMGKFLRRDLRERAKTEWANEISRAKL